MIDWINEFKRYTNDPSNLSQPLITLKSYIEADEPDMLFELISNSPEACIFTLISCVKFIPALRCMKALLDFDTPINKTFEYNPHGCTFIEYVENFKTYHFRSYIKIYEILHIFIN